MIETSAVVFTKEQYNDGTFDRLLLVYVYNYFSSHSNHEVMFSTAVQITISMLVGTNYFVV